MRKKIVAGNWKMNLEWNEAQALFHSLLDIQADGVEIVIFPPVLYIGEFVKNSSEAQITIGAQNCFSKQDGAFTGEISAAMVKSIGATHVLIGHSERRTIFNETNELLKEKLRAVISNGLIPVFCCGEELAIRETSKQNEFILNQLEASIGEFSVEELKDLVLAYEPIWAIGTGLTATSEEAEEMHANIRSWLTKKFGEEFANQTPILYGGSCNDKNASELFACPNVDGGLIGGAALKEDTFKKIISAR